MSKVRKSHLTTIFTLVMLVLSSLPTYVTEAADKFSVTGVGLKVDNAVGTGPCPVTLKFTGYITTDGPGTDQYAFTRSDGASGPVQTIDFKSAGTQSVSTAWTLGDAKSLPSYEGWQAVKIVSPNEFESNHETGSFVMKCGQGGEESN